MRETAAALTAAVLFAVQAEHWRSEMARHEEAAQESVQMLAALTEENRSLRHQARTLQDKIERQQVRLPLAHVCWV